MSKICGRKKWKLKAFKLDICMATEKYIFWSTLNRFVPDWFFLQTRYPHFCFFIPNGLIVKQIQFLRILFFLWRRAFARNVKLKEFFEISHGSYQPFNFLPYLSLSRHHSILIPISFWLLWLNFWECNRHLIPIPWGLPGGTIPRFSAPLPFSHNKDMQPLINQSNYKISAFGAHCHAHMVNYCRD